MFSVFNDIGKFKYFKQFSILWKQNPHFGGNRDNNSYLVGTLGDFRWQG